MPGRTSKISHCSLMRWWQGNTAEQKQWGAEKSGSNLHKNIKSKSIFQRWAQVLCWSEGIQGYKIFWAGNEHFCGVKCQTEMQSRQFYKTAAGICAPSPLVSSSNRVFKSPCFSNIISNKNRNFFQSDKYHNLEIRQKWSSSVCCFQSGDFINKLEQEHLIRYRGIVKDTTKQVKISHTETKISSKSVS